MPVNELLLFWTKTFYLFIWVEEFWIRSKMNYQMLLECYSMGSSITEQEAQLLDIELESQILSIKVSRTQGCIESAPDHICDAVFVCKGSLWITCLAAILDQVYPVKIGNKARGAKVFDQLLANGYLIE